MNAKKLQWIDDHIGEDATNAILIANRDYTRKKAITMKANDYTRPITSMDVEHMADELIDQLIAEAAADAVLRTTTPSKLRAKQIQSRRHADDRDRGPFGWLDDFVGTSDAGEGVLM